MVEKALIFSDESGVDEALRDFSEGSGLVTKKICAREVAEDFSVAIKKSGIRRRWIFEFFGERKVKTRKSNEGREKNQADLVI